MLTTIPKVKAAGVYDASLIYPKTAKETPLRRVKYYELEIVTEDGGVSYFGDEGHQILRHYAVCAKPGQVRHTELPYKCLFVHLEVEDKGLAAALSALPDQFVPADGRLIEERMTKFIVERESGEDELTPAIELLKILRLFVGRQGERSVMYDRRQAGRVKRVCDFIEENLGRELSEEEMAGQVHLSKIYFHNIFTRQMGMTPHEYLLSRRLGAAKRLFISGDMSMGEIASACGFSSQSYFNYAFKHKYGVSPGQYVKNMSLEREE